MSEATSFGRLLLALRKNLHKSQAEVAQEIAAEFPDRVRISQKSLSDMEKRVTAPRGAVLEVLAAYYKVTPTYFYEVPNRARVEDAKRYLAGLHERTFYGGSEDED